MDCIEYESLKKMKIHRIAGVLLSLNDEENTEIALQFLHSEKILLSCLAPVKCFRWLWNRKNKNLLAENLVFTHIARFNFSRHRRMK